jgi:hypothetical protein
MQVKMGVNDEYSRDAYQYEQSWNSDEDSDEFDSQLDPEDWQAVYSEDLLDAWMIIYDELRVNYLSHVVKYSQFIEFVMEPWKWSPCSDPSPTHRRLWNGIVTIETIQERVEEEQFYGWAQQYLRALT